MPRYLRPTLIGLALALIGVSSWYMYTHPLWGWSPLLFLLGFWSLLIGLLGQIWTRHRLNYQFIILSTLSGVLLSAGFPPSPIAPIIFVGFVPLLLIEEQIFDSRQEASRWEMFKYAYNTFLLWNIGTTWWLLNTSFLPGILAIVLNSLFMAIVFTLFHQAKSVFSNGLKGLSLIAFWVSFEWIHHEWDVSWPWLTLGNALSQYPQIVQWYDITGPFGGSVWVLLVNWIAFLLILRWVKQKHSTRNMAFNLAALILLPLGYSLYKYVSFEQPNSEGVEVAVVQPNFEPHFEKFTVPVSRQIDRILQISDTLITDKTKYLVLPETSFGFVNLNNLHEDKYILPFKALVDTHPGLNLVAGITSYRTFERPQEDMPSLRMDTRGADTTYFDVQNAAIQITSGSDSIQYYFKSKLVPGAEFFPYRHLISFIKPIIDMLQGSVEGLTTQEERVVFKSSEGRVAPVICYESIYGCYSGEYIRKGAEMIFIVTNDGWWDNTPGHLQHLKLGALLAIEYRRPIARSANTGISCFINGRGDILQPTKYEETAGIRATLHPSNERTIYAIWGDFTGRVAIFLAVMLLALTVTRSVIKQD